MLLNIAPRNRKLALIALIVLVIVFLGLATVSHKERLPFDNESTHPFNDGWVIIEPDGSSGPIRPPTRVPVAIGEPLRITRTIPTDIAGPIVLCFRSSQQLVRVEYMGEQIYSYGHDERPVLFGKSSGSVWNLVRLPEGCGGNDVTIEFISSYGSYAGQVNSIRIGTKAALIFYLINTYCAGFVVTVLICLAGVTMLVIYYLLLRRSDQQPAMMYLGWFAILISIWMFGESRLVQFFTGNAYFSTCITFICMLACPIPLFKFISCVRDFRYTRLLDGVNIILYLQLYTMTLLQLFNHFDFVEIMTVMHVMLIAVSAVVLGAIVVDCLVNHNRNMRSVCVSMMLLIGFFIVEVIMLYLRPDYDTGTLMRVGVLVFILLQTRLAARRALQILRLSQMARIDALTGCKNRTAYIQRLMELDGRKDIAVILADLDNLKVINDSFGHNQGDDALIRAANCFSRGLGHVGDCYRIGGDEFVFLGCDIDTEKLKRLCSELDVLLTIEQSNVDYPFHLSCGWAIYNDKRDSTLTDTVRRADRIMYRNKRIAKGGSATIKKEGR